MRPTPIPDDEVWEGATRRVIGPPNGDLFSDVQPVEVLTEVDGDGRQLIHVRVALEEDDVRRIRLGERVFWITTWSNHLHPFDIGMIPEEAVVEPVCCNCGRELTGSKEPFFETQPAPQGVWFHRQPSSVGYPPCVRPEPTIRPVRQLPPTLESWAEAWLAWAWTQPFGKIDPALHRKKLVEEHDEYQEDPSVDEAIDVLASLLISVCAEHAVSPSWIAERAMQRLAVWKTRTMVEQPDGTWRHVEELEGEVLKAYVAEHGCQRVDLHAAHRFKFEHADVGGGYWCDGSGRAP